ncbi:unnamed protein product [Soboliphyme baturini]|uniref:Uncharacterized protein n=1 Tax=Soboliphyme baturini TaxID=241478 RepID=A0A183IDW4_9BILA|nr:unnamed protein product [Soboliphyme baturini]
MHKAAHLMIIEGRKTIPGQRRLEDEDGDYVCASVSIRGASVTACSVLIEKEQALSIHHKFIDEQQALLFAVPVAGVYRFGD